jgi:hypothetical protein
MPGEGEKRATPSRRYSVLVGLAFLVLVGIATVNTIGNRGRGILGATKGERGMPLPEFAVPNAVTGPLDKDANVAQDNCSTSENPCPSGAARTPACEIHAAGAIRVCDLFTRPLVLSFWFTKAANCVPTQDIVNRVAGRYRGRVNFLSIDVRDDPTAVRTIVGQHGWTIPIGYDRDGAVAELYRVGVCPTLAFAYPGGIMDFAKVGELSAGQLNADVRRLVRDSRARANETR